MGDDRADFDNLAWDTNDVAWEASQAYFRRVSTVRKLEALVTQLLDRPASWVSPMRIGGYNNLYRMRLEGPKDDDVMIRLPQPSICQFPCEKTLREVATLNFLTQNTPLPVPRVLCHQSSPSDSQIGPYIITNYTPNHNSLSHTLAMPNAMDPTEPHILDPNISEAKLDDFYGKVAVHLRALFTTTTFPQIGSLSQHSTGLSVAGRPLTQNMNNMLQLANIPPAALPPPDKTYSTADEWYLALAEMHIAQLVFQHNDLTTTPDDCRNKYVARQLFRRLAKDGRLSTFGFAEDDWSAQSKNQSWELSPAPSRTSSFRLWCDDFRPSNILLNKAGEIVSLIDWEFAYIAPTQFSLDPPWWLLLNTPEMWHARIDDWSSIYNIRLETWLRAMSRAEGGKTPKTALAVYMRESWTTGRFWLNYAARKSWAFDTIFWKYLDERFFGTREGEIAEQDLWRTRIHLLSERERDAMEPFVRRKMEDSKERILVDWKDHQVKERLDEVLFED